MRRSLVVVVAFVLVLAAAGSAAAQWNLGLRLVGTGNYFPYLPSLQNDESLPVTDTGIYGYKEFMVGYRADVLCYEVSFAFDNFGSDFTDEDDIKWEDDLTWWYVGGALFYTFMQGDGYMGSVGVRYQYGASEIKWSATGDLSRDTYEEKMSGNTSQFSVPFRFMWMPGGGNFGIGPEVAFKYSTGTVEYEQSLNSQSLSMDGPEFSGFDTEYSLVMKFMF